MRNALEAVSSTARPQQNLQHSIASRPLSPPPPPPLPPNLVTLSDVPQTHNQNNTTRGRGKKRGSPIRRGGTGRGSAQPKSSDATNLHHKFIHSVANALNNGMGKSILGVNHLNHQGPTTNSMVPSNPVNMQQPAVNHQASPQTPNALRNMVMRQVPKLYTAQDRSPILSVPNLNQLPSPAGTVTGKPTGSAVVVKHRFKHSRPLVAPKLEASKLDNSKSFGLQQIASYSESSESDTETISMNRHGFVGASSQPVPLLTNNMIKVAMPIATPVQTVSAASTMVATSLNRSPANLVKSMNNASSGPVSCPFCKVPQTVMLAANLYKCVRPECGKQFNTNLNVPLVFPRQPLLSSAGVTPTPPAMFYGNAQHMMTGRTAAGTLVTYMNNNSASPPPPPPPTAPKKRPANSRSKSSSSKKKNQPAECIDLISSDEEDSDNKRMKPASAADALPPQEQNHNPSTTPNAVAGAPAQATHNQVYAASRNSPSPAPSPSPSPAPQQQPDCQYSFECEKAMFGELYGNALQPIRVSDSRIYLSLECQITRENQPSTEKYTLSVGQNDVEIVKVYFGRCPSIVAIKTVRRFAEVACKRIGKDVLDPISLDPKKRYIILALAHAFQVDMEAAKETASFIACVSPWTRLQVMTQPDAQLIVNQACLNVTQTEITITPPVKIGPVETLFVYPPPPKSGGIPITTEDLACLEEGIYLNDVIIDFYLKYTFDHILTEEQRKKTYLFNSYFYKRLTQKSGSKYSADLMHAQVKKWTRNVDIFEKDFIIIPVNEHCHWYLVVICFPGASFVNDKDLNEGDEEEEDEEMADFIKEEHNEDGATSQTESEAENVNSDAKASGDGLKAVNGIVTGQPICASVESTENLSNLPEKENHHDDKKEEIATGEVPKSPFSNCEQDLSTVSKEPSSELNSEPMDIDATANANSLNVSNATHRECASPKKEESSPAKENTSSAASNDTPMDCVKSNDDDQIVPNPNVPSTEMDDSKISENDPYSKVTDSTSVPQEGGANSVEKNPATQTNENTDKASPEEKPPPKATHAQATDRDEFYRPCILIFDSLVGSGHSRVFTNLRNYLSQEWLNRKNKEQPRVFDKTNMKGCYPKIPRQNNDCDCGVFLLQYAEDFFTHPIKSYRMPVYLDAWFSLETVARKRGKLKLLISNLAEELRS